MVPAWGIPAGTLTVLFVGGYELVRQRQRTAGQWNRGVVPGGGMPEDHSLQPRRWFALRSSTLAHVPEVAHSGRMVTERTPARSLVTALGLAALAVGTWWVFLGTDTTRDVDPVTGSTTGPYEAPQVIGCAAVLAGLVAAGTFRLPGWLAVTAVALPFTAAWSVNAATSDDSGLWVIGGGLVLVGTVGGGALVAGLTRALRRRSGNRAGTTS